MTLLLTHRSSGSYHPQDGQLVNAAAMSGGTDGFE
jgi:hypothetical protein